MEQLYQNIKKKREELGMSQEELAKKLKYKSRSSINKIELGVNDLPQSKIVDFAIALDTTVADLMGWHSKQVTDNRIDSREEQHKINEKAVNDAKIRDLIEERYGADAVDAINLYTLLDSEDRAEVRGEIKGMLKADKYLIKKEYKNA